MDLKKFFGDLFGKGQSTSQPFIHDVIERSTEELKGYHNWKYSEKKERAMEFLRMEYKKNVHEENELGATFYTINSASTKGFQLNYRPDIFSINEFQYLFDYLKEIVMDQGYRPYTSDVRTFIRQNHAETLERHYLKPPYKKNEQDQLVHLFGNITIQLTILNEDPQHLKFIANTYSDRMYADAEDHKKLIRLLFE